MGRGVPRSGPPKKSSKLFIWPIKLCLSRIQDFRSVLFIEIGHRGAEYGPGKVFARFLFKYKKGQNTKLCIIQSLVGEVNFKISIVRIEDTKHAFGSSHLSPLCRRVGIVFELHKVALFTKSTVEKCEKVPLCATIEPCEWPKMLILSTKSARCQACLWI